MMQSKSLKDCITFSGGTGLYCDKMGASESKLKNFYNINDLIMEGMFFNHFKATNRETGEIVSVFKTKDDILVDNFDVLQYAIKKIKTIRHPGNYSVT